MPLHSGAYVTIHVPDETEAWHNLSSGTAAGFGLEAAMHALRRVISHHTTLTSPVFTSVPSTAASAVPATPTPHAAAASTLHHHSHTSSSQSTLPHTQPAHARASGCPAHQHSPPLSSQQTCPVTRPSITAPSRSGPILTSSNASSPSPCPALRKPLLSGLTLAGVCRGSAANLIVGAAWSGMFGSVYVPVSQSVEATLARANRKKHRAHLQALEASEHAAKCAKASEQSLPGESTSGTAGLHHSHVAGIMVGSRSEARGEGGGGISSDSNTSTDDSSMRSNQTYTSGDSSSSYCVGDLSSGLSSSRGTTASDTEHSESHTGSSGSHGGLSDSSNLWLVPACAAGAASLCSSVVRFPLEQVTAWQGKKGGNVSSALEYQALVRAHGVSGLYRGWWRSVVCGVPLDAALFTIYDGLKQWGVARAGGGRELYSYETAVAGGVSGAVAALLTFPLDVVFGEKSPASSPCLISSKSKILSSQSRNISTGCTRSMSSSTTVTQRRVTQRPVTQQTAGSLHAAYTAGSVHAAGWRAMVLKSAHKAGWTAFASAVFFPCLEAGIVAFDVHLHETDLGQDEDEENGHDHGPRSGLPTAGMHVYH